MGQGTDYPDLNVPNSTDGEIADPFVMLSPSTGSKDSAQALNESAEEFFAYPPKIGGSPVSLEIVINKPSGSSVTEVDVDWGDGDHLSSEEDAVDEGIGISDGVNSINHVFFDYGETPKPSARFFPRVRITNPDAAALFDVSNDGSDSLTITLVWTFSGGITRNRIYNSYASFAYRDNPAGEYAGTLTNLEIRNFRTPERWEDGNVDASGNGISTFSNTRVTLQDPDGRSLVLFSGTAGYSGGAEGEGFIGFIDDDPPVLNNPINFKDTPSSLPEWTDPNAPGNPGPDFNPEGGDTFESAFFLSDPENASPAFGTWKLIVENLDEFGKPLGTPEQDTQPENSYYNPQDGLISGTVSFDIYVETDEAFEDIYEDVADEYEVRGQTTEIPIPLMDEGAFFGDTVARDDSTPEKTGKTKGTQKPATTLQNAEGVVITNTVSVGVDIAKELLPNHAVTSTATDNFIRWKYQDNDKLVKGFGQSGGEQIEYPVDEFSAGQIVTIRDTKENANIGYSLKQGSKLTSRLNFSLIPDNEWVVQGLKVPNLVDTPTDFDPSTSEWIRPAPSIEGFRASLISETSTVPGAAEQLRIEPGILERIHTPMTRIPWTRRNQNQGASDYEGTLYDRCLAAVFPSIRRKRPGNSDGLGTGYDKIYAFGNDTTEAPFGNFWENEPLISPELRATYASKPNKFANLDYLFYASPNPDGVGDSFFPQAVEVDPASPSPGQRYVPNDVEGVEFVRHNPDEFGDPIFLGRDDNFLCVGQPNAADNEDQIFQSTVRSLFVVLTPNAVNELGSENSKRQTFVSVDQDNVSDPSHLRIGIDSDGNWEATTYSLALAVPKISRATKLSDVPEPGMPVILCATVDAEDLTLHYNTQDYGFKPDPREEGEILTPTQYRIDFENKERGVRKQLDESVSFEKDQDLFLIGRDTYPEIAEVGEDMDGNPIYEPMHCDATIFGVVAFDQVLTPEEIVKVSSLLSDFFFKDTDISG